jgi:hypothetical protein
MTATLPRPATNRIAEHLPPAPIPVPVSPEDRRDAWAETLAAAATFYRSRLGHRDADVAERAARAIFDLEKTRLRHGRDLAGSTPAPAPLAPIVPPTPADDDEPSDKQLMIECDEMMNEIDEGRGPADRSATVPELQAAEDFVGTPLHAKVIECLQTLCRDDRGLDLSRREYESMAKEFAVRRVRLGRGLETFTTCG